ncbi:MAG: hypothetical protein U5K00_06690 [Melioribacteraceae bacterium]|nr:hypothetical protein [Melioribacteraceae bacterium]
MFAEKTTDKIGRITNEEFLGNSNKAFKKIENAVNELKSDDRLKRM